jgi:hypothetical protein
MADMTNLEGKKCKASLDKFAEIGLGRTKHRLDETPIEHCNLMHLGMYFVAPLRLLLFLIICRSRRYQGRNLGSQAFTDEGG